MLAAGPPDVECLNHLHEHIQAATQQRTATMRRLVVHVCHHALKLYDTYLAAPRSAHQALCEASENVQHVGYILKPQSAAGAGTVSWRHMRQSMHGVSTDCFPCSTCDVTSACSCHLHAVV